jgi:hypothetical protein
VTVFQEYKRKSPIGLESVTPSRRDVEGDQLGVVQSRDTTTIHAKPVGTAETDFKPPTGNWKVLQKLMHVKTRMDQSGSI